MRSVLLCIIILFVSFGSVSAQNSNVADSELIAMAHNPNTAVSASYVQGELEVIPIEGSEQSSIRVSAFPNPIKHNITLLTFGNNSSKLKYKLLKNDVLLKEKVINSSKESIDLDSYDEDNYILTVTQSSQTIKSFKILRH